jgi:prepilin-type N-terminal cleavage/methylation domain-containing protein
VNCVNAAAVGPRVRNLGRFRAFTLIELLVVVTIIGVLTALLLPAVQAARESARQSVCRNNLKQMALALNSYHAQHREFPEGARMHKRSGSTSIGWHVLILPHMEQNALYQEIQPDPDGGARLFAANRAVSLFFCPSSEPPSENSDDLERASYVGVAGAGLTRDEWPVEELICGISATDGVLHGHAASPTLATVPRNAGDWRAIVVQSLRMDA